MRDDARILILAITAITIVISLAIISFTVQDVVKSQAIIKAAEIQAFACGKEHRNE
jgi:hypothetical protein